MNFTILLLSLIVLYDVAATPIATTNNNPRIIGGSDAKAGQFPYQVSIKFTPSGMHIGGGSIVSNRWILTCALCTADDSDKEIKIVMGSIYLNSGGITKDVLFRIKHPDFVENVDYYLNDIGLILIKGFISFSDLIGQIKVTYEPISTNLLFTVAGWGLKNLQNNNSPNTLQYISLKSMSNQECQKLTEESTVYYSQICTYSSSEQFICLEENGSPLVYNGEQYGIVSFTAFCRWGSPDKHTKVSSFRDWIKEIANV